MGNQLTEQKISSFKELKEKIDAPDSHQPIVQELIRRNADLFAEKDTDLGRTDTIKMSIDTLGHPPIKLKPYRTLFAKGKIINKAMDDMLAANIIHPSRSPWSFPIVVVDKKMDPRDSVKILEEIILQSSRVGLFQL